MIHATPDVLESNVSDNHCELVLAMSPQLSQFSGHFPQMPILPGVAQLDMAIQFARQYLAFDDQMAVSGVEVLKFQQLIVPGDEVKLTLTRKSEHKLTFSFESKSGKHASGRVLFEELV